MTADEHDGAWSLVRQPIPYAVSLLAAAAGAALVLTGGPSSLTPTTRAAVRETATAHLPGVEWPVAAKLVMVLYQGPYLLGLFGAIGGTVVAVLLAGPPDLTASGGSERPADDALLAALLVHGLAVALVAYGFVVAYPPGDASLLAPFGRAVLLGPPLVVAFTAWGGWAVAVAGMVDGGVARWGLLLGASAPPFVGVQVAHVWPTLDPGPVAVAHLFGTVALLAAGRRAVGVE